MYTLTSKEADSFKKSKLISILPNLKKEDLLCSVPKITISAVDAYEGWYQAVLISSIYILNNDLIISDFNPIKNSNIYKNKSLYRWFCQMVIHTLKIKKVFRDVDKIILQTADRTTVDSLFSIGMHVEKSTLGTYRMWCNL